jgi:replicative superfamily II helicase
MSDEGRGGAMESSMMRLSAANPAARMILLSATMSNAMEVARWVKSLNGKVTKCVVSSWRPTRVDVSVEVVDGHDEKVERAAEMAEASRGRKVIVFVHSKVTGAKVVAELKARRVRCAFHNASLSAAKRRRIEEAFNDADSGLDVIVSTSTLGAGVNMGPG